MKYLITESQSMNLFIRRRFNDIAILFNKKMTAYPPCDYNYEDGVYDYYNDIQNTIIDTIVQKEGWSWSEDNAKIDELSNAFSDLVFSKVFPRLQEYYEGVIEMGCEEY